MSISKQSNSANRFDELLNVIGTQQGCISFFFQPNKLLQAQLRLQNRSSRNPLAYKIKTTNPKRYSVQPNQSIIPPGQEATIEITMQPYNLGESGSLEVSDKFQIIVAEMNGLQADEDISSVLSSRQDGNKRLGVMLVQQQQRLSQSLNLSDANNQRQQQQQMLQTQQPSLSSSSDINSSQKLFLSTNSTLNPSQEEEKRLGEALAKQKNENNVLQQQNKELEKKIKELQKTTDTTANPESNFTLLQVFFIAIVGIVLGALLSR